MQPGVLAELRLLASADLDSHILRPSCWPVTDGWLTVCAAMISCLLPAACECAWQSNAQHHWNSRTASDTLCSRPVHPP